MQFSCGKEKCLAKISTFLSCYYFPLTREVHLTEKAHLIGSVTLQGSFFFLSLVLSPKLEAINIYIYFWRKVWYESYSIVRYVLRF